MWSIATALPDVWELRPPVFIDARGSFQETYCAKKLAQVGIVEDFVQDNESISCYQTIRGLHYQLQHPQAKLCRVVQGAALDVVVDIRVGSPTFGQHTTVRLSASDANQVYMPAGVAHGFLALTDRVEFLYKCSECYDPKDQYGIAWNDADLGIQWGAGAFLLSERDSHWPTLNEIDTWMLPKYKRSHD